MFNENELVRLKRDIPEQKLIAGAIGTVVIVYNKSSKPQAYEIDFSDYTNFTLKTATLYEKDIERL